jgi:hypothetical protein
LRIEDTPNEERCDMLVDIHSVAPCIVVSSLVPP